MNVQKKKKIFRPIPVLTQRMFRANRGRNLVAVLAILLTTMMFTTLFTLTQSMSRTLVEMTFRQTGYNAEASLRGLTEEQADLLEAHPDVEALGRSIVLGLAENPELTGQSVEIRWANDIYAEHTFAAPTTGRMPEAENEIALDTLTLDRLGVPHELGQTVTLEWRKDLNKEETTTSTFTLCGFWEGNQSSYSSMAWVSRAYADKMTGGVFAADDSQVLGLYMVHVNLYSDHNIDASMERILTDTGLEGLEYSVNLAYTPEMGAMAAQESLPMYLGMVLVFAAGYLIIYNIFQISVTADVQFYGRLKTLDAGADGFGGRRAGRFGQPGHLPGFRAVRLGHGAYLLPAARAAGGAGLPHRGPAHDRRRRRPQAQDQAAAGQRVPDRHGLGQPVAQQKAHPDGALLPDAGAGAFVQLLRPERRL